MHIEAKTANVANVANVAAGLGNGLPDSERYQADWVPRVVLVDASWLECSCCSFSFNSSGAGAKVYASPISRLSS
jgi:hypothetical protein